MPRTADPHPAAPEPPAGLSERSQTLWRAVTSGHTTLARQTAVESALKALDAADAAAAIVARDGMTTANRDTGVVHVHPAVKVEKDCRALFARLWSDLDLNHKSDRECFPGLNL